MRQESARDVGQEREGRAAMRFLVTRSPSPSGDDGSILDEQGRRIFRLANTVHDDRAGERSARELVLSSERDGARAVWDGKANDDKAEIHRGDEVVAVVHRVVPPPPAQRFTMRCANGDVLVAQGDFANHHYTFRRGARNVAQVTGVWAAGSDLYEVSVGPGTDPELILACAAVIDLFIGAETDEHPDAANATLHIVERPPQHEHLEP